MTTIALIGNPNCGKTTLFNALTGAHQHVGNWPGVTVEQKTGSFKHGDHTVDVIDLPGLYTLVGGQGTPALDEQIARNYLLASDADVIVNVVDATSLARGLFLTCQLLDLDTPVVVALNMIDVADRHGVHIDAHGLSRRLGCPVIPLVASRGEGVRALHDAIEVAARQSNGRERPVLPNGSEAVVAALTAQLRNEGLPHARFLAAALLEGDREAAQRLVGSRHLPAPTPRVLSIDRYETIDALLKTVMRTTPVRHTLTDVLDRIFLNRVLAVPLFLAVMYLMFMFTINVGSAFIDFFDLTALALFVEGPRQIYQALGLPDFLTTLLADGVGGGVQLVATFIPVIGCLFLFLSFLEDSGYMGRAAFIVDRLMRQLGLPGKSFVPLMVGFGCNVPAVMATRALDNQQDRLLTIIMAPYMSCGARLTVYALFAVAFFPNQGQNLVFGLYLFGIAAAVLSALAVRRYLLTGSESTFVLELPAYHLPTVRGLALHTWHRLNGFVMRAGKAIVAVVIVLNVVSSVGVDGSFGNQNTEKSALSAVGRTITPVFSPMGIEQDNWPATVGIFTGFFAKEVVVGTLDALYTAVANDGEADTEPFEFIPTLISAWQTIPENLADLAETATDPLGIGLGDLEDTAGQTEAQGVGTTTITTMQTLFVSDLAAFAYLVFVLLYIPCVATIGVIYKEAGAFWATFSVLWSLVMAYTLAVAVYQVGQLFVTPAPAALTLSLVALAQVVLFTALIRWGRRRPRVDHLIPVVNLP